MRLEHDSRVEVAHNAEAPADLRRKVDRQLADDIRGDVDVARSLAAEVDEVGVDHRARLRRVLGDGDRYGQLREALADVQAEQRRRREPPAGPDMGPEGPEKMRRWRLGEGERITRQLKADPKILRAESERTREMLGGILPKPVAPEGAALVVGTEMPSELASATLLPAEAAPQATAWSTVTPPYAGWAYNWYYYVAGYSWSGTPFTDPAAGFVGTTNSLTNSSASDFDYGWGEYNASVGFWYRMPAAGLVEVWINGQSAAAHHHLSLYDEWGWSDSWVYQYDYLTMKATGSSASSLMTQQMSWFYEDGYTSGHWDNHYLCQGCSYWAHLTSDVAFPANSWVYVTVGTRTTNSSFANDVSVYSTLDFRWFLPKVYVRSTG